MHQTLFFVSAWCDFHAIDALGASISRMVLYLFPALLMLAQSVEQRRLPGPAVGHFLVAWMGIGMLLLPGWHGGDISALGLLYGFGAALCYAAFWRTSQSLMKTGSVRFNQLSNTFTLILMMALLLPTVSADDLVGLPAFGWIVLLVLFSTVLPFFVLFEGLSRANAADAGVVSMFGPVVTVSVAIMVFPDEQLGVLQWCGVVLVLLSIGALTLKKAAPATPAKDA